MNATQALCRLSPAWALCVYLISAPWRVRWQFYTSQLTIRTLKFLESSALLVSWIQSCVIMILLPFLDLSPSTSAWKQTWNSQHILATPSPTPGHHQSLSGVVTLPMTKDNLSCFLLAGCAVWMMFWKEGSRQKEAKTWWLCKNPSYTLFTGSLKIFPNELFNYTNRIPLCVCHISLIFNFTLIFKTYFIFN